MWYYSDTRITVTKIDEKDASIFAILQPIASGSVIQYFGWENDKVTIQGYIVGWDDRATLKGMKKTGTAYTLSGEDVYFGTYYLENLKMEQEYSYRQTFRPDKDEYDPVFKVSLELVRSE